MIIRSDNDSMKEGRFLMHIMGGKKPKTPHFCRALGNLNVMLIPG